MKEEKTLTDIILEDNKYIFIKNYLEHNKNEILNILDLNVSYRSIFEALKKKTKLNIEYRHFCRLLSDFKKKYIYNLSVDEYKKQMQAISQPAIATPEKKEKEPEKIETKKDVPADEKPSGKIPKWKQEGFSSRKEYFDYLQKQPKNIPAEKKGFVYETSIVK